MSLRKVLDNLGIPNVLEVTESDHLLNIRKVHGLFGVGGPFAWAFVKELSGEISEEITRGLPGLT